MTTSELFTLIVHTKLLFHQRDVNCLCKTDIYYVWQGKVNRPTVQLFRPKFNCLMFCYFNPFCFDSEDSSCYLSLFFVRLLRTDDIRRYLQEKKDELKERSRRWSFCSDASDSSVQSSSSIRSLPQYSSYRYAYFHIPLLSFTTVYYLSLFITEDPYSGLYLCKFNCLGNDHQCFFIEPCCYLHSQFQRLPLSRPENDGS